MCHRRRTDAAILRENNFEINENSFARDSHSANEIPNYTGLGTAHFEAKINWANNAATVNTRRNFGWQGMGWHVIARLIIIVIPLLFITRLEPRRTCDCIAIRAGDVFARVPGFNFP